MADPAATTPLLTGALLVIAATFGIGLVYAGATRSRHAAGTIMMSLVGAGAASLTWTLVGFSLALSEGNPLFGGIQMAGLVGLSDAAAFADLAGSPVAYALLTMAVAALAGAIVVGAAGERARLGAILAFVTVWSATVFPVAVHWVFAPDGWLRVWGVQDSVGGLTLGVAVGASALALAYVTGPRRNWRTKLVKPHSIPVMMGGLALVWVGWLALAGAGANGPDAAPGSSILGAHLAGLGGLGGWMLLDKRMRSVTSVRGAASGAMTGLVAAAASAALLDPFASLLMGFTAGALAYGAVIAVVRMGADDPTDTVGVHLVGGVVGALFVGLFGRTVDASGTTAIGLVNSGDTVLLGKQAVAVLAVGVFAYVASWAIATVVRMVMGMRVTPEGEEKGLDYDQHGGPAYDIRH